MNKRKLLNTAAISCFSIALIIFGLVIVYEKINIDGDSLSVKKIKETIDEFISTSGGLLSEADFTDSLAKVLWTNIAGFSSLGIGIALLPLALLGALELMSVAKTELMDKRIMIINIYSIIGLTFIIVIIGFVMKNGIEGALETDLTKALGNLIT